MVKKNSFTVNFVNNLTFTGKEEYFWDSKLSNFGLRVGKLKKSYFVQSRINGKSTRQVIGSVAHYSPDQARTRAMAMLKDMNEGIDPALTKLRRMIAGITLQQAFEKFKKERYKSLSAGTLVNYKDFLENQFSDWLNRPLREISRDDVITRHRKITKDNGDYAGNNAITFLQTIIRFSQIDDNTLSNPVEIMSLKKLWNEKKRRKTIIQDYDLAPWYKGLQQLKNQGTKDAFLLLLYTGFRKNEVLGMKWDEIDLISKKITLPRTKNKKIFTVPMSDTVFEIFRRRRAEVKSEFVFPSDGKKGRLTELRSAERSIYANCGVKFTTHDTRRTFMTAGATLQMTNGLIASLINHTDNNVTSGYIIFSEETRLDALNKISERISSRLNA